MEPVPETERMEFGPTSTSQSRIRNSSQPLYSLDVDVARKPPTIRRSTDPSPTSPNSSFNWTPMTSLPYRPRNASPLSGGAAHTRSRSAITFGATAMGRTQSMPGVNGAGHILFSAHQFRPASPLGSPSRVRTPRKPVDEAFPMTSPVRSSILDHDGPPSTSRSSSPTMGISANSNRMLRPSSPLRNYPQSSSGSLSAFPSTPSSSSSSLYKAYDAFSITSYSGNLSSVPSTPTSARSRSPSISSLETIPDSPDAEEAALEAERMEQLRAATESPESTEPAESKSRGSLDVPSRGRTMTYGSREKRKRWSVCGAERRGDLDLETIWED